MADQKRESYDVIVVGSGASGGWASKRLAEAGLKVALLEAGRPQLDKNFSEHKPRFELKYRNLAPKVSSIFPTAASSRPFRSPVRKLSFAIASRKNSAARSCLHAPPISPGPSTAAGLATSAARANAAA